MSGVGSNFGSSGTWKLPIFQKKCYISIYWMGGRAVEGTGLENRQARKRLVGSNPTPSAITY
jgi:hypothetical protein